MNITMQNIERLTLDQIREFVEGSRTIGFTAPMREAVYEFIERVLKSQQYRRLSRGQKGIVRRFLVKMTVEPSTVDTLDRSLDEDQAEDSSGESLRGARMWIRRFRASSWWLFPPRPRVAA